jgi:SAM-dependent methyltransferase
MMKPRRLYELLATFFHRQASTLDVGCGSGRDLAFLQGSGFKIEGLDAVPEFVEHCHQTIPSVAVHLDRLPKLEKIMDASYANVLVSAVLNHITSDELKESVANLIRITTPGGRLIVANKQKHFKSERDDWGRLQSSIQPWALTLLFESLGANKIYHEESIDDLRKEIIWDNFVFEKMS